MPQIPHIEHHFDSSEMIRDAVIGMSNGLTVAFCARRRTFRHALLELTYSSGRSC
jgi:hypothetical protein